MIALILVLFHQSPAELRRHRITNYMNTHYFGMRISIGIALMFAFMGGATRGQEASSVALVLGQSGEPDARIVVPLGGVVKMITAPGSPAETRWQKDGVLLPDQVSSTLILSGVSMGTAGTYSAVVPPNNQSVGNKIKLTIRSDAEGLFVNFSGRIKLSPGQDSQIVGFVVKEKSKSILIRAVGESLRQFGIVSPVKSPRFQIYNSRGERVNFVIPGIVLPPDYWSRLFASAGAFPLNGNEVPWVSFGAIALQPGAYTVHVSDDSQLGGEVLLEIYEAPVDIPYN